MKCGVSAPTTSRRCSRPHPGRVRGRAQLGNRVQEARRVPQRRPRLRRRQGRGYDRPGRRPAGRGRLDHPQPIKDPGHHRQCPSNVDRVAEPGGTREVIRRQPQAVPPVERRPSYIDPASGNVRKSVESRRATASSALPVCTRSCRTSAFVNDHVHGCFRATDYPATSRSRTRA